MFIFLEKYDLVGRLLRPGEEPTNYSDEEDDSGAERVEKLKGDETSANREKSKNDWIKWQQTDSPLQVWNWNKILIQITLQGKKLGQNKYRQRIRNNTMDLFSYFETEIGGFRWKQ